MKSFKAFCEGIDPVKLAQRASRVLGDGNSVRLKHDQENADEVHDKYWKVLNQHKKQPMRFMSLQTHDIKDLHATQDQIETHDPEQLSAKIAGDRNFITTATHNNRTYILNGHHSIFGRRISGKKQVDAYHVNLDNYNSDGTPK